MSGKVLTLKTPEGALPFTLTHRPRVTRRMHLELDEAGGLVVVVPGDWPDFYTRRLLRRNLAYVRRFLARASVGRLPALTYSDGGQHLWQGRALTLRVFRTPGRRKSWRRSENELHLVTADDSPDSIRRALQQWYRNEALTLFTERLAVQKARTPWAQDRELTLRLRRMKRTWGTCSRTGVIRLNTHLVKAPLECLDYVICHELCHLREMNHGPGFYALQDELWPEWRQSRERLKHRGSRYTQE